MTQTVSDAAQLKIVPLIAKELGVGPHQVAAPPARLDEGSTVPFIARYRKEVTGNLDDTHLRTLEERLLLIRPSRRRSCTRTLGRVMNSRERCAPHQ